LYDASGLPSTFSLPHMWRHGRLSNLSPIETVGLRHRHRIRASNPPFDRVSNYHHPPRNPSCKITIAVCLDLAARYSFVHNPRGVKRAIAMPRSFLTRLENCDFTRSTSRPLAGSVSCSCHLLLCHTSQMFEDNRSCACSLMTLPR
jgi:hypothetical protein